MIKKRLTIEESEIILDLYNYAILNGERRHDRLSIDLLKGYTFDDIDIATKIFIAHGVSRIKDGNEKQLAMVNKTADLLTSAQMLLPHTFIPPNIFDQIRYMPVDNYSRSLLDSSEIEWPNIGMLETAQSFLEFCLENKKDDNYWNLVYKRIGFENIVEEKSIKSIPYSVYLLSGIFYGFFAFALFFPGIRQIAFIGGIIMNFLLIVMMASDSRNNKKIFQYTIDLVLMVLGIIFPSVSLYILLILFVELTIIFYINKQKTKE